MKSMDTIRIVLVEPEQARNIGAVVRVAANFGLTAVNVVRETHPNIEEQREMRIASAGALDLVQLNVNQSLKSALRETDVVVGTSGRPRDVSIPVMSNISFWLSDGPGIEPETKSLQTVAVLFGRESRGLSSEELSVCHGVLKLPVSPAFPSMNISHAVVAVLCQAMWNETKDWTEFKEDTEIDIERADEFQRTRDLQEAWLRRLEQLAGERNPQVDLQQLRFLLHRAKPTSEDMSLLFNLLKLTR